jgi:hypothetical protein
MEQAIRAERLKRTAETSAARGHPLPAWFDEVTSSLAYASHIVCSGNVRDLYPSPTPGAAGAEFLDFDTTLWHLLSRAGVAALLLHSPTGGLRLHPACDRRVIPALEAAGLPFGEPLRSLADLADIQSRVAGFAAFRIALLLDYASQIGAEDLAARTAFFVAVDEATRRRAGTGRSSRRNPTIWIADKAGDLPEWFAIGNDHLRDITVERPDLEDRFAFAQHLVKWPKAGPAAGDGASQPEMAERLLRFALECDGETLRTMSQIALVAKAEHLGPKGLSDAVRTYRTGLRRNPWASPVLRARVRQASERLSDRIVGQPHAIEKTLDILARSIVGLSGTQDTQHHRRPRGVLFFAGPTGVGKTELAKAVTELLFGDDSACHRFDMSEFMEEGAITRLIGAPPGQAGHDRGGELVNAVHKRPFSVFLFDEIEKAHPRILDIFLQILDEGRLTDARGATGHFSEALIIFTSNLGMIGGHRESNMGMDVMPSDTYRQIEDKITRAVHEHFRYELKRPELINRIGHNIVVFDFLRYAQVSRIFDTVLARVLDRVEAEQGLGVELSLRAREDLKSLCTHDVFDGGRGVGNRIEAHFVNPLSRAIFEGRLRGRVRIEDIDHEDGHVSLRFASPDGAEQEAGDQPWQ